MIVFAGVVPHPPILIPEIGKDEEKKIEETKKAYERLASELAEAEPDTIIVVSPHMVHYPHLFNVCGMEEIYGSFESFGFTDFEWQGKNNLELAEEIVDKSEDEGLPAILYNNEEPAYEVDHGVLVPLYFIAPKLEYSYKVLPLGYSYASRAEHFAFGQLIGEVCAKKSDERIAIIASGDLSHRLISGNLADIDTTGAKFDAEFAGLLGRGDEYSIINMDEELVEKAGECGYRSVLILLGALSGREYQPKIYSYEGPFGVGYMVANMNLIGES